jgi:hypothetical protein
VVAEVAGFLGTPLARSGPAARPPILQPGPVGPRPPSFLPNL